MILHRCNKLPRLLALLLLLSHFSASACQCPLTGLGMEEAAKYELIFRGRILSVTDCGTKPGEAVFEVQELFRGNATREFTVLFDCRHECAVKLHAGEEWIIYTRYKQINNAMLDWCSRSRKYFRNEKEDFYSVTYGNDYYTELEFLRKNLGQHRLLVPKDTGATGRNNLPGQSDLILYLLLSLAGIVLFYILFRRFMR